MQKTLSYVRKCIRDYRMIESGDHIAVGVSGGKDSMALLCLLAELRKHTPVSFSLSAITLDLGFPDMDFSRLSAFCQTIGVPLVLRKTEIREIVFDIRQEKSPCALCAKMRRGILNEEALRIGANKIALGHHLDDAVETFLLSLLYEGRMHCFLPVTYMDRSGMTAIRPLLYLQEKQILQFAEKEALPITRNRCPVDQRTKREEAKKLLTDLEVRFPGVRDRIFRSLQHSPLPGWSVIRSEEDCCSE